MRLKPSTAKSLLGVPLLLALAGCSLGDYRLFNPVSKVAHIQYWATIFEFGIMCIIIVPVTLLIAWFTFRYRKKANAAYDPSWSHSLVLEILVWGVPLIIVAICGIVSIRTIHAVDPYGPKALAKEEAAQPVLEVDVITTDWQWLFVYPQQHIAVVDELVIPQGHVVQMRLTSTSVTNDFFIPQLASMIDVMPGMRTKNTFDAPQLGTYMGYSADFSGAGFSWMQFGAHVVTEADFNAWVANAAASPRVLTYDAFTQFAQPTVNEGAKVSYFSNPDPQLFDKVVSAAMAGVVYPVSDAETHSVADTAAESASK